jgi:putative FmdB family regulatory protein
MPIYGYECNDCGHDFEKLVRAAGEKPACPACESRDLTRQLSLIAAPARGGSDALAAAPAYETGGGCAGCPCIPD